MAAILRAAALGLLILAITLHVVGFVTQNWVRAKFDSKGIESMMSANDMNAHIPKGVSTKGMGMTINMGLWKFCMRVNLGDLVKSMPAGSGVDPTTEICKAPSDKDIPDWWKAVQALGILSLIAGVLGVATMIYSFIGDIKGDRARLLPHILATICLVAGMLLLIAVAVYGAEFQSMMDTQMEQLSQTSPMVRQLVENIKEHTHLGYSFILEALAGVLMVIIALVLTVPVLRGDNSFFGGPQNLAV